MEDLQTMKINLEEFAGGEFAEKINLALRRVQENCLDLNTPYKNKRQITAKIVFNMNEARDNLEIEINVDTKLANPSPTKTHAYLGKDLRTGKIIMEEYGKQIKGQISVDEYYNQSNRDIATPDGYSDAVDLETGEVINNPQITPLKRIAK